VKEEIRPERNGDDLRTRTLFDLVATLKSAKGRTLGVNGDWATEDNSTDPGAIGIGPPVQHWMGIAGYLRNPFTSTFAVTVRGELFDDRDGVRTGTSQKISEFTVTPECRLTPHFLVRADVRADRSNQAVFLENANSVKTQTTMLLGAIYAF